MVELRTSRRWMLLLLALAVVLGLNPAFPTAKGAPGDVYYVAPDGNDSYPGTEDQPWRTLQKAADTLMPGDTVLVKDGTYSFVNITRSGEPAAWIEFRAYPGHTPHVHATGWTQRAIRVNGGNYIIIDGFEATSESEIGIGIQFNDCHHGIVRNCIAHDNGESGIVARESDWITAEHNIVYGNSRRSGYQGSGINFWRVQEYEAGEGFHYIIRGNLVYDNINLVGVHSDGNGIIIDNSRAIPSVLIEENVCFDNGGRGIDIYNSDNVTVRNNTLYRNKKDPAHAGPGELLVYGDNVTVHNNIIYSAGEHTIAVWQSNNLDFGYNLHYGGTPQAVGNHDVFDDPQFVNPSVDPTVADLHLLADSPAIGAGMDGLDIGAYEYTGGVQPSPTPTPTATSQPTSTPTPTPTPTATSQPTGTPTPTPTPTATATSQPTSTPTPTPRPNPNELVIDNSDSEFSTNFAQDPWREYVQVGGQHYGDSHYYNDQPGVGEDTATWSFDVLQPGKYEVHAWWWEGSRRPSDVPYTVHHLGGSTIVKVDQQAKGGQWNLLGTFDFQDQGSVVISDDVSSGQGIVADAVRLVYLEPLPSPTARPNLTQRIWLPVVRN